MRRDLEFFLIVFLLLILLFFTHLDIFKYCNKFKVIYYHFKSLNYTTNDLVKV